MPTITDFNDVEFVDVYAMKLDRPSVIVSGITASGPITEFKFFIDENTDIDDVIFVVRNHCGCARDDIGFVTAGFQSKHREGHEKISDIYGPKQREGQAYRFKRREMMGVAIWPKGYEEAQKARQAKCFTGPKPYPGYEKFYEEREITIREAYEAKIKKAEEDRIRREEEDKPIDIVELNKRQAHLLVPKKEPEDEPKEEDNKVNASGEEKLKAVEEEDATEEHSSLAAKEPSSSAAEEPEASEKSK